MPPIRPWGVTRNQLNTLNSALIIVQQIRDQMAQDAAYAGNVPNIDFALQILNDIAKQVSDHIDAGG